MKDYIGTKLIKAKPMNRLEYNNYRGWDLPADEDGSDEGYLVEYVDGGKSNHPDHAGYISWSPVRVFGAAYCDITRRAALREITDHKVNHTNDTLKLTVLDDPGQGGACHKYLISHKNMTPSVINFQNGPIDEFGVNGLTPEVLLSIVADRLRSFQDGPYNCKANACALTHIEEAQHWLQQRTLERMRRGVEGTHEV
jgi:hypothetical protein